MTNQILEDELQDDGSQVVNVNAVSLGKSCNHSVECQLRDPYSRCVHGVCECMQQSSTCSSKKTGMPNNALPPDRTACTGEHLLQSYNYNMHSAGLALNE